MRLQPRRLTPEITGWLASPVDGRFRRHLSPKPDLFTKQPHGHCLDWEKPGRSAQPVAVSSSTGERAAMTVAWVGCSSHPPQQKRTARDRETDRKLRSDAACDGKRISPCRRVGSGESSMAAGKDRRLKTRTASRQNLKILPFLHSESRFWHTRFGLSGRCFRCCGCW